MVCGCLTFVSCLFKCSAGHNMFPGCNFDKKNQSFYLKQMEMWLCFLMFRSCFSFYLYFDQHLLPSSNWCFNKNYILYQLKLDFTLLNTWKWNGNVNTTHSAIIITTFKIRLYCIHIRFCEILSFNSASLPSGTH